jgi:redox-sensitive bicupin YhaK (pirin superfamily)
LFSSGSNAEVLLTAEDGSPLCAGEKPYSCGTWWNLVGRSHEEIEAARRDWMESTRFGEVQGYDEDGCPPRNCRLSR